MAPSPWTLTQWCICINLGRRPKPPPALSILPLCLASLTCFLILVYMSFTFDNFLHLFNSASHYSSPSFFPVDDPPLIQATAHEFKPQESDHQDFISDAESDDDHTTSPPSPSVVFTDQSGPPDISTHASNTSFSNNGDRFIVGDNTFQTGPLLPELTSPSNGSVVGKPYKSKEEEVYHDKEIFLENYKEMKTNLKIYIYPHNKNDPFAHALLPTYNYEPSGNYASESYFKNELFKSHFITNDPSEADLFYLPFSIASLRHDQRVGVGGLPDFVLNYMNNITKNYPYWNRTGGADHFYVACHSVSKKATDKVNHLKSNAIQVVCSSSYFLSNYYAHKDVCLPQIWPRHDEPSDRIASISQRKKLAFFAGSAIAPLRKTLVQTWENDSSIAAHGGRLKTPYSEQLLRSKYCLHVKGFEVNTARIGDAMYYGCVPVILADYYDLPFMDILNWKTFSVVITSSDIPNLKKILQSISPKKYTALQANVLKVRKHFQWNNSPLDFDAFYMTMYELWLRRSSIKVIMS